MSTAVAPFRSQNKFIIFNNLKNIKKLKKTLKSQDIPPIRISGVLRSDPGPHFPGTSALS